MDGDATDIGRAEAEHAVPVVMPRPRSRPPQTEVGGVPRPVTGLAVVDAWSRLLAYLVVATMVSVAIMMPVVGVALALAGGLLFRIADLVAEIPPRGLRRARRRLLRALAGALLSLPYAVAVGTGTAVALASLVAVGVTADPLIACAWGVGAGVYVLWAGPGVRVPRRGLARLVAMVASDSWLIGVAGMALGTLAFLAIVGAVVFRPSFAPMYALQNSLQIKLGDLQSMIEDWAG